MKRAALAIVSTVASLVLLLSFKTHTQAAPTTPPAAVSSTGTTATGGGNGGGHGNSHGNNNSASASGTKTYTGTAVMTRYGPVQVRITVRNGHLTDVTAVTYPNSNPRDGQINAYAIPRLNSEAASAGSASINMISGATYTSQGYISSLQSAIDQAGL